MQANTGPFAVRIAALLRGPAPVVVLLLCHVVLGTSAAGRKSLTFDEGVHLTGGFSYWAGNDYRLHPENGNWSQRWAALPLSLGGFRFPPFQGLAWQTSNLWEMSDRFLFESDNDLDAMLWRGRSMMAVASVVLAFMVYLWSRRLFGAYGGLISLTLYAFSPTMLANGFLTTSDLFVTLFFTAAVAALWGLLHCVSPLTLSVTCIAMAGVLLSKFSGVLIAPIAGVLVGIRLSNPEPLRLKLGRTREVDGLGRQLAVFATVTLIEVLGVALVIWASYGFRYSAFSSAASDEETQFQVPWHSVDDGLPRHFAATIQFARDHHLLPEAYLYGFGFMIFGGARIGFLNGQCSQAGWLSYFPACLALKTPLALFLLLGLAVWALRVYRMRDPQGRVVRSGSERTRLDALTPLLVLLGVYWMFALSSSLNIGHRHILPTYPPLFILAGAAALWFQTPPGHVDKNRGRSKPERNPAPQAATIRPQVVSTVRAIIVGALAITVLETIWFWPHYLAYFNLLSGRPTHAYRRLVDSSLDWGQDLKELKRWLDDHPNDARDPRRVYLAYFGMARPEYYGIEAQILPGFRPRWYPHIPQPLTGGLYCVSATMVQPVYMAFPGRWNAAYETAYQQLRGEIEEASRGGADMATFQRAAPHMKPDDLQTAFRQYEDLRFGRLASFLRLREPDAEVGYSILIYRLTDDDVRRALAGPPPEPLLPKPEFGSTVDD
jgi:hypothetical protein